MMTARSSRQISQLLAGWGHGDREDLDKLIPLVYEELRRLAHRYMRRERPGHTLQTSALINEAFIRLIRVDFHGTRDVPTGTCHAILKAAGLKESSKS